ncbi:zf-HC2 domain-containing protein [Metabacillus arenae]|uniref:Anti-sigma factor n=1 Tax=Metabacillus arenae TaxID=2771434 RepID=A0A926NJG0_9BACI|nr:zf-HC2 domain-containing protein [Metabacillus arenae]MBD1382466.1 anti-sigma factor [Metabacillus arenae]
MSCPKNIAQLIHEHLDGEIGQQDELLLKEHLKSCKQCYQHYHDLEKSIALVQSTSHIMAPNDFTNAVMNRLPKEKKTVSINRWFKGHPLLVAASLFLLLMAGSLVSAWNEDHQFSVSKQPNLVVENNVVTVPEGVVVEGDVLVKNGDLRIDGKVKGDVTVVNGKVKGDVTVVNGDQYLASAGEVTGDIEEVDELFEWLWYHIRSFSEEVVNVFQKE